MNDTEGAESVKLLNLTLTASECGKPLIVAVTVATKLANGKGATPGCLNVKVDVTKPFGAILGGVVEVKTRPAGTETSVIATGETTPGKPFRLVTLATAVAVAPGATTNKDGLITRLKSQILIWTVAGDLRELVVRSVPLSLAAKFPKIVIP